VTSPGTARELRPIAEEVLAWVAAERQANVGKRHRMAVHPDDLRRIELCALATREAAMFFDLYGVNPSHVCEGLSSCPVCNPGHPNDWNPQEC
jgi:hypothetical protein